jgi:hypothetical protein
MDTYFRTESLTIKEIRASDYPVITKPITLAAGQNLPEGAVLGKITDAESADVGKCVLSVKAATDGSQKAYAVLTYAVDATSAAKKATAYMSGDFVGKNLTYGTGHDKDSVFDDLRAVGVYVI